MIPSLYGGIYSIVILYYIILHYITLYNMLYNMSYYIILYNMLYYIILYYIYIYLFVYLLEHTLYIAMNFTLAAVHCQHAPTGSHSSASLTTSSACFFASWQEMDWFKHQKDDSY